MQAKDFKIVLYAAYLVKLTKGRKLNFLQLHKYTLHLKYFLELKED
jgi:hypothetical protein